MSFLFHEIFWVWLQFQYLLFHSVGIRISYASFSTLWELWKFTLTYFWQKFRESNFFFFCSRNYYKTDFSEKISVIENVAFSTLAMHAFNTTLSLPYATVVHSVEICKFFPHDFLQKFRQIDFFTKELYCKNQFDEKFLHWGEISKITTLWTMYVL